MADLDDLNYPSILDMSNDEALETLRQIRLSRRTPEKKVSTKSSVTKAANTKTRQKVVLDPDLAASLLKILGGSNDHSSD